MIDPAAFEKVHLHGGFVITEIKFTDEPMADALGREAIAQTSIVGRRFRMIIRSGLSDRELSITLYHEILEAATVASIHPPESVMEFNEGDFERVAQSMHIELGDASPGTLNRMLQSHGFGE